MAKKRLVVCCDGTWNDADSGAGYTNVSRLAWAITPTDTRDGTDIAQIVFYQSGVGSEGDILGRIKGGGLGLGLAHNVRDAYTFACNNYSAGDEIFLFGFSRGAYTARSIAGLIGYAGLILKHDLDRFFELWEGYRSFKKPGQEDPRPKFKGRHEDMVIRCIGVWDTVGSVGIPGNIDFVFKDYYGFHDTDLGERVEFAFHALALDEQRKDFAPTLWHQKPEGKARNQVLKQVWFAGAHSDVGGGYPEHGLSDIALAWMASEVEPLLGIDFGYLKDRRDMSSKWSLGLLHDSADSLFWKARGRVVRIPLAKDRRDSCESIHPSVAERINGGANALPGKYASSALGGIDPAMMAGKLSQRETALQWSAQDVRSAAQSGAAREVSFRERIIRLFGGS
jgi:uncharacterized protein (DUF2235 family)